MQLAAKPTKAAIASVTALGRWTAAHMAPAIRLFASGDASQGLGMDVTNSSLPRDDKRDSERERGQASTPSVHCFGSAKQ